MRKNKQTWQGIFAISIDMILSRRLQSRSVLGRNNRHKFIKICIWVFILWLFWVLIFELFWVLIFELFWVFIFELFWMHYHYDYKKIHLALKLFLYTEPCQSALRYPSQCMQERYCIYNVTGIATCCMQWCVLAWNATLRACECMNLRCVSVCLCRCSYDVVCVYVCECESVSVCT